jgi:hypothetical protein
MRKKPTMVEPIPGFAENVLAFATCGHVTKHDYEALLIPAVREAVKAHDRLRLYCEIDRTFDGLDANAIWDDVSLGFEAFAHWERVAIVTDVVWIAQATRLFGVLVPFRMKLFPMAEAAAARAWIAA